MKLKLLLLFMFLLTFLNGEAQEQEPLVIKYNYATGFTIDENEKLIKEVEKIYYPTTLIVDIKKGELTFKYPKDPPLMGKISKINISADKKQLEVFAETDINKSVLFQINDEKTLFIDTYNSAILLQKK